MIQEQSGGWVEEIRYIIYISGSCIVTIETA